MLKHDGKWAQEIISLQKEDGTWGWFHGLSHGQQISTEQALRRLRILGYTIEDAPIRKAVDCMTSCLNGERKIDEYSEKKHDWALFAKFMLYPAHSSTACKAEAQTLSRETMFQGERRRTPQHKVIISTADAVKTTTIFYKEKELL